MKKLVYFGAAAFFLLTACSVKDALEPQRKAGFVNYHQGEGNVSENSPFYYAWIKPEYLKNPELFNQRYKKWYLQVIATEYLEEDAWKNSINLAITSKEQYEKNVRNLAEYLRKELKREYEKDKGEVLYEMVDGPGPDTLLVQLAFTEVGYGDPVAYAGAYAVPVPGSSFMFDTLRNPIVAFEVKYIDEETSETVVELADRKTPKTKPFDINKFTINRPVEEVVDRWVEESSDVDSKNVDQRTASTLPVGIIPW